MKNTYRCLAASSLPLAARAAVAPSSACVSVPASDGEQPILATHVQDWRDEVIYQVIADRFADGDVNNDFTRRARRRSRATRAATGSGSSSTSTTSRRSA